MLCDDLLFITVFILDLIAESERVAAELMGTFLPMSALMRKHPYAAQSQ